jgi:uridine kinase
MKSFVTAVSGVSGAGKSSVVERTVALLGDAKSLHFDAYAESSTYPADLKAWAEAGADVDEWKTPALAKDLRELRASGEAKYIVIEEPFGKLRAEMRELIDLAAHIDVPADVLLARRLLRRLDEERHKGEALLDRVQSDLEHHLDAGRDLDALASIVPRDAADVVLDGTKSVDELARELVSEIRRRCP